MGHIYNLVGFANRLIRLVQGLVWAFITSCSLLFCSSLDLNIWAFSALIFKLTNLEMVLEPQEHLDKLDTGL
jgi:hypothetical protein